MNKEPLYILKQDEVYRKKREELKKLKDELKNYKKCLGDGLIDSVIAQYNLEISKLSREYYSVLLSRFLDLADSSMAIAYYLSKVTGENYGVYEYEITLYEDVYSSILNSTYKNLRPIKYNICFLATSNNVNKAYNELESLFKVKDYNNYDSYYKSKDGLRNVSDNYILLAYYKGSMKDKKIEYTYNNFVSISDEPDTFIVSQLKDERYSYILDYIDKIIEYKLDSSDLSVSISDMKKIADGFVKILKK